MGEQVIDEEAKEQHGEASRDKNVMLILVSSCISRYRILIYFIDHILSEIFLMFLFLLSLYLFQAFLPMTSNGNETVKVTEKE